MVFARNLKLLFNSARTLLGHAGRAVEMIKLQRMYACPTIMQACHVANMCTKIPTSLVPMHIAAANVEMGKIFKDLRVATNMLSSRASK